MDSVFELSSQTIKSLNDAVKREKSPVLLALLIELCSISGLLFQLKRLSQEAKSPREWGETVSMLCKVTGPFEKLKSYLELLNSKYSPKLASRPAEHNLRTSSELVQIKSSIQRQKTIFAYALQNDPKCVVSQNLHTLTHVDKGAIPSYE